MLPSACADRACFNNHQMSVLRVGVGPQVNTFEQRGRTRASLYSEVLCLEGEVRGWGVPVQ